MSVSVIKSAVMGAVATLAVIYAFNQVSFTKGLVQKALVG